jgi:hypothetical protein
LVDDLQSGNFAAVLLCLPDLDRGLNRVGVIGFVDAGCHDDVVGLFDGTVVDWQHTTVFGLARD